MEDNSSLIRQMFWGLPWPDIITNIGNHLHKITNRIFGHGIYEVLSYEMQLDLYDSKGERASYQKRQVVRYLQDHVIAYQDQAWGDGKILLNYRCSPGKAVDRYRLGHKTLTLISLRQIQNRGSKDTLQINWDMKHTFITPVEEWTTSISHRMQKLKIDINFPHKRPPIKLWLIETNHQKQTELGNEHLEELPDGRWQFSWAKNNPQLYEDYTIRWQW